MNARQLLCDLEEHGVLLQADGTGTRLVVDAPVGVVTADIVEQLGTHKSEILSLLAGRWAANSTGAEGVPPEWITGLFRLIKLTCQSGINQARWQTLQMDAARFTEHWGAQAARLGWTACDVYGVNRVKPFERLDGAGLVRLLGGRPVVALTESKAVIECLNVARQTFRRNRPGMLTEGERCLLWEIGELDSA